MKAWKLIGLGVVGLIIVAGAASVFTSRSTVSPTPLKPPVLTVSEMITAVEDLNGRCRGGSGDDPATMVACDQRDQMMDALKVEGMCWGNPNDPNEIGADKTWRPCPSTVAASHPPEVAQEVPSPEVQYDPAKAVEAARLESAMSATRGCLRAQTKASVMIGIKGRDQVAERITGMCREILLRVNVMHPEEVAPMVRVMAYDAIEDVQRESAG